MKTLLSLCQRERRSTGKSEFRQRKGTATLLFVTYQFHLPNCSWKNEGPYESYALRVYENYVATNPAKVDRFAETIRAFCSTWACQP